MSRIQTVALLGVLAGSGCVAAANGSVGSAGDPADGKGDGVDIINPPSPLALATTSAPLDPVADELESDHGTFEDGNAAYAFLYDYAAPEDAGLEDALAGVVVALAADGTFKGGLESKGERAAATFRRALAGWGFGSGFMGGVREVWGFDTDEPVVYGKLAGAGTTSLESGSDDPATGTVYVALYPQSQHVLAVLDYQLSAQ